MCVVTIPRQRRQRPYPTGGCWLWVQTSLWRDNLYFVTENGCTDAWGIGDRGYAAVPRTGCWCWCSLSAQSRHYLAIQPAHSFIIIFYKRIKTKRGFVYYPIDVPAAYLPEPLCVDAAYRIISHYIRGGFYILLWARYVFGEGIIPRYMINIFIQSHSS